MGATRSAPMDHEATFSRNHRYVESMPALSEIDAVQPSAARREESRSLRGVPSGIDGSNRSSIPGQIRSRSKVASSAIETSTPVPTLIGPGSSK